VTLLAGTGDSSTATAPAGGDGFTYRSAKRTCVTARDCCTGPTFAIDAIAAGKQAAISIHRFVHPGQSLTIGREPREYVETRQKERGIDDYDHTPRQKPEHAGQQGAARPAPSATYAARSRPKQVQKGTARASAAESRWSIRICASAAAVHHEMKFDAIHLVRRYDGAGVEFTEMKPVFIKQILKRKGKIMIKKSSAAWAQSTRKQHARTGHRIRNSKARLRRCRRKRLELRDIASVVVEVGEASTIVPRYLKECWPAATDGTEMERAQRSKSRLSLQGRMQKMRHGLRVPQKQPRLPQLRRVGMRHGDGQEFNIKEIVVV
jgi:Zn finger protein HypA/HybF involved in hydrogenase expression